MTRTRRGSETPADAWRRTVKLDEAKLARKKAERLFDRTLDEHMRTGGREATAEHVLQAARQLWQARELVRRLQPAKPRREEILRDKPAPRAAPKRVSRVVSGGLPGQKRRK